MPHTGEPGSRHTGNGGRPPGADPPETREPGDPGARRPLPGGVELAGEGLRGDRFAGDDGSADPQVAESLAAFASGRGSEREALAALAAGRLLVPVVAALSDEPQPAPGSPVPGEDPDGRAGACASHPALAGRGEKSSEMALPTLVGRDGRPAIPAFTSIAALARWRPAARPLPTEAALVWQAAVQDSCAVVIDVAGPVPLAVEGARLTALASGEPLPPPHQDADVRDAVGAIVLGGPPGLGFRLAPPTQDGDLLIELRLPAGLDRAAAGTLVSHLGSAVMELLGARLRRGIEIAVMD